MLIASIPSPSSNAIHLGPLALRGYGLMLLAGIVVAILVTRQRWRSLGGSDDLVFRIALWGVVFGIVGARLYHDMTSWNELPDAWWGPFAVWEGGLGIWGGVLLGALAGAWLARREGASVARFADAVAPGLLLAQGIGRIGNYFNQELFGKPTSLPWALEIDPEHRPSGYESNATFHPTFLYEFAWDVSLAVLLIWIGRRFRIRPGGLFALYVAGYSFARIFEELLRIDPAHSFFGLRLNFFVAAVLFLAASVYFVLRQRLPPTAPAIARATPPTKRRE